MVDLGKQPQIDWRSAINAWNAKVVISRLYRDNDGDLIFLMGVAIGGGVTNEFLKDKVGMFRSMLTALGEFDPSKAS